MKESRKIRNKIGKHPLIRVITDGIETSGGKQILRLKQAMPVIKTLLPRRKKHTKKLKRLYKQVVNKELDNIINGIGASWEYLETSTNFSQKDMRLFFIDFFVQLTFHK